jgi:hypothetical protein
MSRYGGTSEPTPSGEGEWVDFPASSDPDPWAVLLAKQNHLASMLIETQQRGNASSPGRTPMVKHKPSNHVAITDHGLLKARHYFSFADYGGAMMTSLAVALRGLLVTTIAVAIVAFLLLTNSHI